VLFLLSFAGLMLIYRKKYLHWSHKTPKQVNPLLLTLLFFSSASFWYGHLVTQPFKDYSDFLLCKEFSAGSLSDLFYYVFWFCPFSAVMATTTYFIIIYWMEAKITVRAL
jgi:hypothetical protein